MSNHEQAANTVHTSKPQELARAGKTKKPPKTKQNKNPQTFCKVAVGFEEYISFELKSPLSFFPTNDPANHFVSVLLPLKSPAMNEYSLQEFLRVGNRVTPMIPILLPDTMVKVRSKCQMLTQVLVANQD